MSRENVEIVAAMWAAYSRGDAQAALDAYSEDTVCDDTLYRPDGAVHVGREAIVNLARTWRGTWQRYDIEAEDVLDAGGERVAALLRETGQGKGGGVELTNRWGVVMTVRNGKIAHTVVYPTPLEALEAVGLR